MKKIMRNKGFTLVELLAVLVVLAILAVITIPVITKVINKTKNSSFELSVSAYGKAAENGLMAWAVENQTGTYEIVNDWNTFNSVYGSFIETKGEEVTCTDAKVTKDGKLSLYYCSTQDSVKDNKYYNYIKGKTKILNNTSDIIEYKIGDVIKYKDIEWYVIKNVKEGDETVKLMYTTYLTENEIKTYGNTYISGVITANIPYYISDTCNSNNQSDCNNDYIFSQIKIVLDNWGEDRLDYNDLIEDEDGYKVRLIKIDEYEVVQKSPNSLSGLSMYWTMSKKENSNVDMMVIQKNGLIASLPVYHCSIGEFGAGIRPVIELSKSAIQK